MNTVDIENTQARLLVGPHDETMVELRFLPGVNHVNADLWEKTKAMGSVPSWIKMGWLRPHGTTPEADDIDDGLDIDDAIVAIGKMTTPEAVAVIERMDVTHRPYLEALVARDNRESVTMAARLRLDALKS